MITFLSVINDLINHLGFPATMPGRGGVPGQSDTCETRPAPLASPRARQQRRDARGARTGGGRTGKVVIN